MAENVWLFVCVRVCVGHETKAMQNNSGPRYKRSNLERKLNIDIIWSVVLLLLLCITAAVGKNKHTYTQSHTYLIHTLHQQIISRWCYFLKSTSWNLVKKWLMLLLIRPWCVAEQPEGSDLYDLRWHTPSSCWLLHVLDHDHCSAGVNLYQYTNTYSPVHTVRMSSSASYTVFTQAIGNMVLRIMDASSNHP